MHMKHSLLMFAALSTSPLSAQSTPVRLALDRFRDSLSAIKDTAALVHLAAQYEDLGTRDSNEALANLRAGFARLRVGMPGQAKRDFRRAATLQPTWPVPWLGIGDAHAALGLRTLQNELNLGTRPGLGEFRNAAAAYARALELDPRFVPGIEAELRLAVERRDTSLLATAVAHARLLPAGAATPAFLVALSRAEWRMGNVSAAATALEDIPPDHRTPTVEYELARALLAEGDAYGEFYYWSAVAADDPGLVSMLSRDLSLIATPEEMATFQATPSASRPAFLHQFWDRRDALALRPQGQRMREHYARIAYADRHYAFSDARHFHKPGDLLNAFPFDSMLDSRGVVYVRMGAPDIRFQPHVFSYVASESWVYYRVQDTLLLTFAAQNSIGDMVLVRTADDINCGTTLGCCENDLYEQLSTVHDTYRRLYYTGFDPATKCRAKLDPSELMSRSASASMYKARLSDLGMRSIETSTHTDAYPLRFPTPVTAQVLPLAVGAATGGSGVQVAVALVQSRHGASDRRDTLRIRFAAFDTSGSAVVQFDSTVAYAPPPKRSSADSSYTAFGHFATTLPAGTWRWTAAVQSGDSSGALLASQLITIPVHDASTLAVSDLIIGAQGQAAYWAVAPGDTAWLTPRHGFQAGMSVGLYFEVYGIPEGQTFRAELTARRGDIGTGPGISLAFEERSSGTPTRIARTIGLSALAPGDYAIEVQVKAASGTVATSHRPLRILKN